MGGGPPPTDSDSVDFTVDSSHLKRPTRVLAHKRKRLSNHQITKPFHQSGGDWIRTSDHAPPELNFYFFNKFNELYFNVFSTLSESCSLPLSGVVAISRVPPVFHASFTTRSKLKSESPTSENAGDYSFGQPTQNSYFRSRALMRTTFPSRTTTSSPSSFLVFSIKRLRASKIPALIFFLHLFDFNLAHNS